MIAGHPKFKNAFGEANIVLKYLAWYCCRAITYICIVTWLSRYVLHNQNFGSDKEPSLYLIGASKYWPEGLEPVCGLADIGSWWAMVFNEYIQINNYNDSSVLLTTVHEIGHALGLTSDHYLPKETKNPRPGFPGQRLECVMTQGGPALPDYRDHRFRDECLAKLKTMNW